jgi:hypothetical protein
MRNLVATCETSPNSLVTTFTELSPVKAGRSVIVEWRKLYMDWEIRCQGKASTGRN